jgi:beta-mannosidase
MRLHGPWDYEPLARTLIQGDGRIETVSGHLPGPGRLKLPAPLHGTPLEGFRGRIRWRRRFHPPRTLEQHEHLWLVFEGVDYFADVSLNGAPLGRHQGYFEPFEFDATPLVAARNELVVETDCPVEADPASQRLIRGQREKLQPGWSAALWGDVALEVRSVAFLRHVQVHSELLGPRGTITVTGLAVGQPGVGLTLQLSVAGAWQSPQKIAASPDGTPFQLYAAVEQVEPWWPGKLGRPRTYLVELELHGLARTLDKATRRVGFRRLTLDDDLTAGEVNGRRVGLVHAAFADLASVRPSDIDADRVSVLVKNERCGPEHLLLVNTASEVFASHLSDQADSLGLLLRQDFPLAGRYSTQAAFRNEACRQASAMVRQIAHHPSIAAWCCHLDPGQHDDELDSAMLRVIAGLDPTRPCLRRAVTV